MEWALWPHSDHALGVLKNVNPNDPILEIHSIIFPANAPKSCGYSAVEELHPAHSQTIPYLSLITELIPGIETISGVEIL